MSINAPLHWKLIFLYHKNWPKVTHVSFLDVFWKFILTVFLEHTSKMFLRNIYHLDAHARSKVRKSVVNQSHMYSRNTNILLHQLPMSSSTGKNKLFRWVRSGSKTCSIYSTIPTLHWLDRTFKLVIGIPDFS